MLNLCDFKHCQYLFKLVKRNDMVCVFYYENLNDEKHGKYPCQDILNPMRIFTMLPSF